MPAGSVCSVIVCRRDELGTKKNKKKEKKNVGFLGMYEKKIIIIGTKTSRGGYGRKI